MSNFWSVLGAAAGATAGAIIDEMDRQDRPNVTVRFVERPAVRVRVSAPVETVRIVDDVESDLRGRVYKSFGWCPDYYVVIRENIDGTVELAKILSSHSYIPMSRKTISIHSLRNDYIYARHMSDEEFARVAKWL